MKYIKTYEWEGWDRESKDKDLKIVNKLEYKLNKFFGTRGKDYIGIKVSKNFGLYPIQIYTEINLKKEQRSKFLFFLEQLKKISVRNIAATEHGKFSYNATNLTIYDGKKLSEVDFELDYNINKYNL